MKTFDAVLSNDSCIFDHDEFKTASDVVAWAKGRGGTYNLQVDAEESEDFGLIFSVSNDHFWKYNGYQWKQVKTDDVISMISKL